MYRLGAVRHFSELSHSDLRVKYGIRSREKDRYMYALGGISGPDRVLQINDGSIHTLRTALLERMFYHVVDGVVSEPGSVSLSCVMDTFKPYFSRVVRKFGQRPTPVSPEQFVEMYTGRKKAIMSSALERLTRMGLSRRDAYINVFVKLEKVKRAKAPRCIQPRRPEYNICVGRFLKHIEHRLYRSIQHTFGSSTPVVAKGLNADEVGVVMATKWQEFDDPVAIGLDAQAFDLHVTPGMLQWEHMVYLELYRGSSEVSYLKKLLSWQVDNYGYGFCYDGKLKYKMRGRRCSGDMNTAMGNCLIMCGVVYSYCQKRFSHYQLINNGDDCVVFVERRELPKFEGFGRHALGLGFKIVLEPTVDVLERVEFCQANPILVNGAYRMVRTPGKAREKDSISILHHQNLESIRKWLSAVGDCGLALCSGVPVMQELYMAYIRNGVRGKVANAVGMDTGASFLARGMDSIYSPVTSESRVSFYLAFNVTPDEQIAIERLYQQWVLGDILDVDTINMVPVMPL